MAQTSVLKKIQDEDLRDVALVRTSGGACLRGHLSSRQVVVKLLSDVTNESEWLSQMREAVTVDRGSSDRVLLPVGVYRSRSLLGLVWDWMEEGSLHALLYEAHLYPDLPIILRHQILLDVAEGLKQLHAISLPHGALKATNVLLDQHYRAKLCDWGQPFSDVRKPVSNGGSPCYRDLAYLSNPQGGVPSTKADIYSFGVLMWEALNRRQPCEGIDQLQTLLLSAHEDPGVEVKLLPSETPQCHALTQLMIRCWSFEPKQRPSAEECVVALRKAMAAFNADDLVAAVRQLKAYKERALLSSKRPSAWALPIELNNLEGYSGSTRSKNLTSKTIPLNVPCSNKLTPRSSTNETIPRGSSPFSNTRVSNPAGCCRDRANSSGASRGTPSSPCTSSAFRQCAVVGSVARTRASPPPNTPCSSPTTLIQAPLHHPSAVNQVCNVSAGWSCCRLLQEKREAIVHCMTEGRLNYVLDVLRARQVMTREAYEVITAALTLTARTRCLLDTCVCLGENVALLVATMLGLVSVEAVRSHGHPRTASRGQAC